MEAIPQAIWNGIGVISMTGAIFWMLLRGDLVTRREHESVKTDRDYWRETAMTGLRAAEKMASQKSAGIAAVESLARSAEANGGTET